MSSLVAKPFWAKDLLFVVTNGGQYGMQAWLESYLGINSASEYIIIILKSKEKKRSRQDSNLRGETPMDF